MVTRLYRDNSGPYIDFPTMRLRPTFPLTRAVQREWQATADRDAKAALLPAYVLEMLQKSLCKSDCDLAWDPSTDPNILAALASSEDIEVLRAVARNPATPARARAKLAHEKDWIIQSRLWTADYGRMSSGRTSPAVVADWACDPHARVRASVAGNLNTPFPTLVRLARDRAKVVRRTVAERVEWLNDDKLEEFAAEIAKWRKVPAEIEQAVRDACRARLTL